ncbi:hypothetical protein TVAG_448170 [Trichomonas vaginalis G3]|uniref:DUF3447 domain-containing protein n=1 Tax=Trichomonas vaginalis (strain ATCC PRA-98 / G3) TaxID=412133 RepID=A2FQK7_TRIV3|nr:protein ubiquitination [Trichomonas vaginalis G3]EAX92820.1 hypothetical protein TVAG_448170 [Trichomonas vaginalis G3]KAI5546888.1 protein ubiquitination [Trichomonas vaginalis G3]|eukprot:XP_001305750.1 hypothetical protein [Trichomonas vaginalis G3]
MYEDEFIENVPESLRKYYIIENLVFDTTIDNVDETIDKIYQFPNVSTFYLINLIIYAAEQRRFNFKALAMLFSKVRKGRITFPYTDFIQYAEKCGYVRPTQIRSLEYITRTAEELEIPFPKGTIAYEIATNNYQNVVTLSANTNLLKEQFTYEKDLVSCLDIAAACGNLEIFNYLQINGLEITQSTIQCAISGGNNDIIETIAQQGHNFEHCILYAIHHHRHKIFDWLLDEYGCIGQTLTDCIASFNTYAFIRCLEAGLDINETDHTFFQEPPFLMAVKVGIPELVLYITEHGGQKIDNSRLLFSYATTEEVRQCLLSLGYEEPQDGIRPSRRCISMRHRSWV